MRRVLSLVVLLATLMGGEMRRAILLFAVLALCLPMVGEGQSIQYNTTNQFTPTTSGVVAPSNLLLQDGTVGAPSLAFASDVDTGFYLTAPGSSAYLRYSVGGSQKFNISNTGSLGWGSNDVAQVGTSGERATHVYVNRSTQGSKSKALTEGAATNFVTIAVPQTAGSNYAGGEVLYSVYATDGTDTQVINGSAVFSAVNKAGTETCTITDDQIGTEAASAGTLVCTITCATGLTDVVALAMDCTSSLTQSTLNVEYRLDMPKINTMTPQ